MFVGIDLDHLEGKFMKLNSFDIQIMKMNSFSIRQCGKIDFQPKKYLKKERDEMGYTSSDVVRKNIGNGIA